MRKLLTLFTALLFVGSMWGVDFTLVTSTSSLAGGDEIIIVNADGTYAIGTTQNTNNRKAESVTVSENVITPSSSVQIITLEASSSNWKFKVGTDQYLYAAGGNGNNPKNYLKTANSTTAGDNGVFSISIGANGVATIQGQGNATNSRMRYNPNSGNPMFSCYSSTSTTGSLVKIFKKATTPSVEGIPAADVDMGSVKKNATNPTSNFTLTGENLTANLSLAFDNESGFTVSPATITPEQAAAGQQVTISHPTDVADDFIGTLTISSDDFDDPFEVDYLLTVIETYAITVPDITGGILTWDPAKPEVAAAGEQFTLTATPTSGYEGGSIAIQKASDHSDVTSTYFDEGVLTMPAFAIDVIVTFTEQTCTNLAAPTLDEGNTQVTYEYANLAWTAVANAETYAFVVTKHGESTPHVSSSTGNTSTMILNLDANTQYDYSVMAKGDGSTYCDESNPLLEGSFTTDDYPAATLTLSENGITRSWGVGLKLNSVIDLPTAVAAGNEVAGKVLVGWSADADRATAPELAKGANYTMNATAVTLYAVYATETPGTPSLTKMVTGNTLANGDKIVIVASGTIYGLYHENASASNYVKNWTFDGTDPVIADLSDDKKILDVITGSTSGKWKFGNSTDGYLSNSSSTNLTFDDSGSDWTFADLGDGTFTLTATQKLSCRTDLTSANANLWRGGNNNGVNTLYLYKYDTGTPSYSDYTTTGAKAPTATVDPEEVEISAAALVGGLIDVTYENVNLANVTVALFNDAECTEAFDGGWLTASLDANKDIVYGAEAAVSYANVRTAYIKLTAPATEAGPDPAVVVIPVEQAKKEAVFASLDDLVASDVADGDSVTITLSDVAIKTFYMYKEKRAGVTFDVQKAGNDIRIFKNDQETIVDWEVGGTLSGTFKAKWGTYNDEWQLSPAYSWAWANLTYKAPSATAIDNTEVEGKAVKVLRNGVLYIEKNGVRYNAMGQLVK